MKAFFRNALAPSGSAFLPASPTLLVALPALFLACNHAEIKHNLVSGNAPLESVQGVEEAAVASVPNVPPAIKRNYSTRVVLHVEIREQVRTLAEGVTYTYWSFGDETPGKFIRVREGDMVEVHLSNHPDNALAHNIDFHAATGPGGGGEASFIAPGHTAIFAWRAIRPGLFLYHCVAAPAGMHISNGMYGLILVEPKMGLPPVDREYAIVQGEFYTTGAYGEGGHQDFSLDKAIKEQPEYVVFNGKVGALMGANALKAKVGERVRLYLGNAGPSLISSFHIVGEIFDNVYAEGGVVANQNNVQTTMVPVGGSSMVEFSASVPGEYTLVDHSMFRAFNKGTMGQFRVEGKENEELFSGRMFLKGYAPGTSLDRYAGTPAPDGAAVAGNRAAVAAVAAVATKPIADRPAVAVSAAVPAGTKAHAVAPGDPRHQAVSLAPESE